MIFETPERSGDDYQQQLNRDRFYSESFLYQQNGFYEDNHISSDQQFNQSKLTDQNKDSPNSESNSTQPSYKEKFKTEICKNWEQTGKCKYGNSCAFAHGDEELQKKRHLPSKYKTKLCKQYHEAMYCAYGNRCQFVHSTRCFDKKLNLKNQETSKPEQKKV